MAKKVRIGHASTDTPGSGSASDEVLISNYSESLKPTVVLRPKTASLAEKSAAACEKGCNNNKIEYSQSSRNTLNTEAKKVGYDLSKIATTCYTDCSSFMTVCAIAGGASIDYGTNAPTCGNMKSKFVNSGDYAALTDSIYLSSSNYLKRGDILVRENYLNGSRHTVMILDNGSKVPTTKEETAKQEPKQETTESNKIIKVSLELTSVTTDQATITAKITKLENNKEASISAASLKAYKWTYRLESLKNSKVLAEKMEINNSHFKFYLNNLTADNLYRLKVTAAETDSEAEFSSPWLIFTTRSNFIIDETKKEFKLSYNNCKLFVKIKDIFKRATLYK